MARKIVITSGKGGVGKTTLTARLGMALARRGIRVALVDLDLGLNNLDVAFGVENRVVFDLSDVIEGRCRIKQAFVQPYEIPTLYLLPSSHAPLEITQQNVRLLVQKMEPLFDYILFDCPAGIETGFHRAVACAEEAIVVCTPNLSSIRDANKVLGLLETYDLHSVRIVVNRMRGDLVKSGEMMDAFQIFGLLQCEPLGILPEWSCMPSDLSAKGSKEQEEAFDLVAGNLHDGTCYLYDYLYRYRSLWERWKARRAK